MDIDKVNRLVTEDFVNFRAKVLASVMNKHPQVYTLVNSILAGRRNMVGMHVTENGMVAGEYTFHLEGLTIGNVETGVLASEIHHPLLGIIRPYVSIEASVLERIIKDERFMNDFFGTLPNYLPEITIRFLG
jgi:hypothetical protein